MKSIRFLPLVFIMGIHGFAFFASYAVLVLGVAYVAGRARPQPQPALLPI